MMKVVPTRVGDAFQAEIPPLLTPEERTQREARGVRPPSRPQWTPTQSVLNDDEIAEYLRCSRMHESEAALQCLHDARFNVHKAAQFLHKHRLGRARAAEQRKAAIDDETFETAVTTHGKRFFLIRQHYPEAKTGDLVARFYQWKTTTAYKKWHERAKAKKNKETARLRQWADAEGESDTSDFHNEYCELCFTGGQLLCCDGCERAYHFSCVEPPIKDVPMGDWFCTACAAILGTETELTLSDENAFCDHVVVLETSHSNKRSAKLRAMRSDDEDAVEHKYDCDNDDVATDGNETEEIDDTTMDDVVVKQEPAVAYQHARLYTPERPRQLLQAKRPGTRDSDARTPTRSPLLLESTNRKRQRKIVAPRRIPQAGPP